MMVGERARPRTMGGYGVVGIGCVAGNVRENTRGGGGRQEARNNGRRERSGTKERAIRNGTGRFAVAGLGRKMMLKIAVPFVSPIQAKAVRFFPLGYITRGPVDLVLRAPARPQPPPPKSPDCSIVLHKIKLST